MSAAEQSTASALSDKGIHFLDLHEVSGLLRSRQLSPVELATAMLARVRQVDSALRSFVRIMADDALVSARAAEEEITGGMQRGPLHGVPLAIKDIFWTRGTPTAAGMAIHQNFSTDEDATVVQRLRAAGAVLLGKLTLTEGVYAEHRPPFAAPTNPWNADYWSGASSSGSAVAVAAGLCFGALASETGGSIKLPAAVNGVTGLKPTWGRVSRHGVFELAASLDHVGVMTRSARDAAILLEAIAGADPRDPTAAQEAVPHYTGILNQGVRGLRIGLDPAWISAHTDDGTANALDSAIDVLRTEGAHIHTVRLPDPTAMIWDWFGLCAVQTALAHEATFPQRRGEYGPALAALLDTGHALSGIDYQRLLLRAADFKGRLNAVFRDVDVLALPVLAFAPPTVARMGRPDDELIAGLHRFTCPFNMSGHPGIVMPCGSTAQGVPIAFQLVGGHFSEAVLLNAAHAYQQRTHWHRMRPALS